MRTAARDHDRTDDDGSPPASTAHVVAVTTIVQTVVTMCSVIPAAIGPELARAFDLPASLIGVLISLIYLGAMATSVVGGLLVRRLGPLRTSQWALAFGGVGVAMVVVPSYASLVVAAVLIGFGYGLTNPAASHLLMRVTRPDTRNMVFSLKQTSVPLGGVAAGLAAPTLALDFGWQWAMLAAAALALATGLAIQPYRRRWDRDRDPTVTLRQNPTADFHVVWREPVFRWISLTGFCFSAVQLCLTTFAVTMLVEDLGFGLVAAGIALSVLQVAGVSGRLFWGGAADRLRDGNRVLMITGAVAAAAGVMTVFLGAGTSHPVVYGVLILFGGTAIGWNGVFMAEVARLAPDGQIGSVTGGIMVPTYAGVLVGPVTFAAGYALVGHYTVTFGFCAAVSLIGLAALLAARRRMAGG